MKKSLSINFIYSTVYQILIVFIPLITTPYISRTLGAEKIGIYSYSYSVAHYFMLVAMLGVKNYGNRCIAMVRDDKKRLSNEFWNIYILQLLTSIISIIVYFIYIGFILKENINIAVIQSLYIMTAAVDITWFFYGLEEVKMVVKRNTTIKFVNIILIFMFVKNQNDLWKYTLIMSGGMLIGYLCMFPFLKGKINFVKVTKEEVLKHIKPNLILFIPVIAVGIFNIMDKIMLGIMSTMKEVGYYENAEKMMRVPFGVVTSLGTVMMPRMSNLFAVGKKKEAEKMIEISMFFIMFLGCGMAFGLAGVSKIFSPIFFGKEFVACGNLLRYLSVTILFLSWANVIRTQFLIPNHHEKYFVISTIIGAVVNVIINSCLIWKYGALGCVIGTIGAEASVAIYQSYAVRKYLNLLEFVKSSLGFVFSGIFMFVILIFMEKLPLTGWKILLLQIIIGGTLYLLCSWIWLNKCTINFVVELRNKLIRDIKSKFFKRCKNI